MAKGPYQRKDRFYLKAKNEGYPSRSAYKLLEFDKGLHIFKPGSRVIDLGSAPGGWLKVGEERLKNTGQLVGIDILPLQFLPRMSTEFLLADFTHKESQENLLALVPNGADWVLSDLSPNISGIKFRDTLASAQLCEAVLAFALRVLKPGGNLLTKAFPGPEVEAFRKKLLPHFQKVFQRTPEATRRSSNEIYFICLNFKSRP